MKRRIISLFLAALLLLSLTGCASDTQKLRGTWVCHKDMTDQLNHELAAELGELEEYFVLEDVVIDFYIVFREDQTFRMYLDEAQVTQAMNRVRDQLLDGMMAYFSAELSGLLGMDVSLDDLLEFLGMSREELYAELGMDTIVDELMQDVAREGNYLAEEGKLYTSDGVEQQTDEYVYELYELEGKKLTILGSVGMDAGDYVVYPLVFEKIK